MYEVCMLMTILCLTLCMSGNIGFDMESKDENATISWLDKDGQAEIDGSLAVGDKIIEVGCNINQLIS